ncbi:UNVERIFIED_CONTAM: Eukaryotic translation initiation factor 4B3 [Sesamum radiatum]|uniref:Eukaryotic translation initiation factor 4B3 n=1 Tax=Sesamum radiatum TaxID=300843 RepID=A0AAW2S398_SESRA
MAATVSAWGKPGAWALDSEENEAELLQQHKKDSSVDNGGEAADFPSLAAAATTTKTKKKKPQALSLQEFSAYGGPKPAASQQKGLTPDELLLLPTGPRQRSAEELDRNKLGEALDLTVAAPGTNSRAVREALIVSRVVSLRLLGLMKLMIGGGEENSRVIMGLTGGRGEKEGVSSLIHNREQMRLIIGRRKRVLFPLSPGDMRKEEDLDWNRVMVGRTRVIG